MRIKNLFGLSAKTRITIGLACLSVSILLAAIFMGMIPDRRGAILDGRRKLCEAVAIHSSVLVGRNEMKRLEAMLNAIVMRNDDLLSAGIRRSDGQLMIQVGDHLGKWRDVQQDRSIETQLQVALHSSEEKWGSVEMRFRPLRQPGLAGVLFSPVAQLVGFVGAAGYIIYLIYLHKMLKHLDPSKTVPRRVRSALDSLAEGLLVADVDQRILLANQAFSQWVEQKPERLIGRPLSKLPWSTGDECESQDLPWARALRDRIQVSGAVMELNVDGQRRTLMVNATPILGNDDQYRGVLISLDDVTQLEETKRELHQSKQAADQANRAKSEFLARMSHEIRTPMNAILGFADVLRRGFEGSVDERQDYLNTIHTNGQHLLNLINDILDLSKVESGKLEVESQRCFPFEIATEVVTVLRVRAKEKGITLDVNPCGMLPESILSDAVRLRQIITNLAGNAIKFTQQGGVRIDLRLLHDQDAPQLQINVVDTGIGMRSDALRTIFDPFSQADTSITRRFGGTGLGLSICKSFAEALGGTVTVESEYGKGSQFKVTIDTGPLDDVRLMDAETLRDTARKNQEKMVTCHKLPPCRILVADDGPSNRKLINLVLGRAGAQVDNAENGQIAVDLASQNAYDVILMDMQMPIMDGYAATERLRQQGLEIPIIALTANAMKGAEAKCRAAGCSGFMTKPIDVDRLISALAELLSSRQQPITVRENAEKVDVIDEAAPAYSVEPAAVDASPADSVTGNCEITPPSISSTLPTDDPEFAEIVVEFAARLAQQLDEMDAAWQEADLERLAQLAHWLKGSGGTAGFDEFSVPAVHLEQSAKRRHTDAVEASLAELRQIASRIVLPSGGMQNYVQTDAAPSRTPGPHVAKPDSHRPLESTLPTDDPEFAEIVVEFDNRLREQIGAMDDARREGDLERLAGLAHWLKGSGGTAGFDAFTQPARELEYFARDGELENIDAALHRIHELASQVVLPSIHVE